MHVIAPSKIIRNSSRARKVSSQGLSFYPGAAESTRCSTISFGNFAIKPSTVKLAESNECAKRTKIGESNGSALDLEMKLVWFQFETNWGGHSRFETSLVEYHPAEIVE
jgi:hypothetical protein